MEQLGIALAGVLVGAIVTEGLRFWRGYVETRRRLRGARRLVRNELIVNGTMLADATPEVLRERLKTGAICVDQWAACEVLLAETLSIKEWTKLAAANLLLATLAADIDLTTDEDLKAIADDLSKQMDQAQVQLNESQS